MHTADNQYYKNCAKTGVTFWLSVFYPPPYYSLNFYKLHHLLTFLPQYQSFVCGRFAYPCLGQKWWLRPLNNLLKFLILNLLQLGQNSDKKPLSKYLTFAGEKNRNFSYIN